MEADDEAEEHDMAIDPEIPGVGEEEAKPESQEWVKKKMKWTMMNQHKTRLWLSSHQHHPKWETMWVAGITCVVAEIGITTIAMQEKILL